MRAAIYTAIGLLGAGLVGLVVREAQARIDDWRRKRK